MIIRYELVRKGAQAPTRAHNYDAAFDLCAFTTCTLKPGARHKMTTGVRLSVADGYVVLVLPRSGLALEHGVTVLNAPGLVDGGYRGEVCVVLANLGLVTYKISKGDRIAQIMAVPFAACGIHEGDLHPPPDDRDVGGFGSTGR